MAAVLAGTTRGIAVTSRIGRYPSGQAARIPATPGDEAVDRRGVAGDRDGIGDDLGEGKTGYLLRRR